MMPDEKFEHPKPVRRIGPLVETTKYKDLKDPCIVFDGTTWHIYGSGGDTYREEWEVCHATAPSIEGPWSDVERTVLRGVDGLHVAAPSVVYDAEDKLFHMAVQKDFTEVGGDIAYLVSADGNIFTKMRTILAPNRSDETGLYDPHFCVLGNKKYVVYSAIAGAESAPDRAYKIIQPDIYLAKSTTDRWAGHWKRVKAILRHEDVAWHHNSREHADYEWGLEGPQLVELPDGHLLLNATSFLEEGPRGTRQRVFFALSNDVRGPYKSLGPVLSPTDADVPVWENGENGHASAIVCEDKLYLFYQARSREIPDPKEANNWRWGTAVYNTADIIGKFRMMD